MDTSQNLDEETKFWLEEKLIPNLKITLNQQDSVSEYTVLPSSVPIYVSSVFFLEVKFTCNGEEKMFSLVVKRPSGSVPVREFIQSDKNFHNEILFYDKCAKNSEDYPRCLYTFEDPPTNSVLVLENISKRGFQLCPQIVNLEMRYVLATFREIGRFHAKFYVLKNNSPKEFFQIVDSIQEGRYENRENNSFALLLNNLMKRVIKCLRKRKYDEVFCDKADVFFSNAFENVMQAALSPEIPLATLCHGDCTRNNVFFKQHKLGVKAMLFDFALINYGSPAVDLSTFLYLSVPREDIKNNFSIMYDVYHDALMNYLEEAGLPNLEEFSKDRFLQDYKRHALFGYMIANFFLPVLHGAEKVDLEYAATASVEEILAMSSNCGGDEFTKIFTDMLLDMRKSGCLDHILTFN